MSLRGVRIITSTADKNTYDDFDLIISNADCVGEPEFAISNAEIPGRNGLYNTAYIPGVTQKYTHRDIHILLAGQKNIRGRWKTKISVLRNLFHGKEVDLIFDNDLDWAYRGQAQLIDFESLRGLGRFALDIPNAYPYKLPAVTRDPSTWRLVFGGQKSEEFYDFSWATENLTTKVQDDWDEPSVVEVIVRDLAGGIITIFGAVSALRINESGSYRLSLPVEKDEEIKVRLSKTGTANPTADFNVSFLRCSL